MVTSTSTSVLSALDDVRGWQEDFYRNLHEYPQLSHEETNTAAAVAHRLGDAGFDVHTGVGGTGVVGILRNGDGPAVLLRADMDALPVREQTGLPYASAVTATDGDGNDVAVMHACGHDVHVTCLLGAAALLASIVGAVDVALGQHVLPFASGTVRTRPGPVLSAADSVKITVYGRGGHGYMPQATVDPGTKALVVAALTWLS